MAYLNPSSPPSPLKWAIAMENLSLVCLTIGSGFRRQINILPGFERTGRLTFTSNGPEYVLKVVEVDTSKLDLTGTGCDSWVERPSINGVVVCYDSSREETFDHTVEGFREFQPPEISQSFSKPPGEFAFLKIPLIVMACKSDLEKRVDPTYAMRALEEFDAGLVEVSTVTPAGKERIRDAFEWLLRAIYHELRESWNH